MSDETVNPLPQSDVDEIVRFQEYLSDLRTMKHNDFYRKYQMYMGLSDEELATALRPEIQS